MQSIQQLLHATFLLGALGIWDRRYSHMYALIVSRPSRPSRADKLSSAKPGQCLAISPRR